MTGFTYTVPITTESQKTVGQGIYENKTRVSFGDKETGSYGRTTVSEKASAGDFQWKNGTSGSKAEYKESSTVRVGDKSGYTEFYHEQRIRNVNFDPPSSGSKSITTYDNGNGGYGNGNGGQYGAYGYGYDSGSGGYGNGNGGQYGDYGYGYGYESD